MKWLFIMLFSVFTLTALAAPKCDTCPRDGHVKRSVSAKNEFKREYPCPATGERRGACPGYVIDHVVPLKRGGEDKTSNMQWQTKAEAREKDKWE